MKKVFFTMLLASLFLGACNNKNYDDYAPATEDNEIVFNTHDNGVTRAVVQGTTMTQDFAAYGYASGTGVQTPGYIMSDAHFDKDGNPMGGSHYYWPVVDDNTSVDVVFTCLSPYTYAHSYAANKMTASVETPTVVTKPKNDDNAVDLLYASTTTHPQTARVPLTFKHALSWIEFQGKFAEGINDVKIKSVLFSTTLNTTADFVLNTTDDGIAWNNIGTPKNIEFGDNTVTLNNSTYRCSSYSPECSRTSYYHL